MGSCHMIHVPLACKATRVQGGLLRSLAMPKTKAKGAQGDDVHARNETLPLPGVGTQW